MYRIFFSSNWGGLGFEITKILKYAPSFKYHRGFIQHSNVLMDEFKDVPKHTAEGGPKPACFTFYFYFYEISLNTHANKLLKLDFTGKIPTGIFFLN